DQQSSIQETLADLIAEHQQLKIHASQELENRITEVKDAIADLKSAMNARALRSKNTETVDLREISDRLGLLAMDVKSTALENRVLTSLTFDQIQYRQEAVAVAHQKTFDWALDPWSPTKLESWLRTGSGIYWIKGKAGSGKSTLMKYLATHPHTMSALQSFFFWNAGAELQKSQEGLFRSLLYEILRQSPELIRPTCGYKMRRFRPFRHSIILWTLPELRHAIGLLKEQTGHKTRFCFFIDGLDEYNGDPDQIIDALQSLRGWPDIKICVSSRPWNEFQDAFGQPSDPQLSLEDLTRNDINNFVRSSLEENMRFRALSARDSRSHDLVQETVEKAQSVFLWVVLVVKSLLTGLRNADRVSDLQRRLREFPATLEEYFHHMLASIDPFYRKQTAQAFKVALGADKPLYLLTYSFLDEEDIDSILEAPANQLNMESILIRQDDMRRRLNGRCKGLLEVIEVPWRDNPSLYANKNINLRVDFLHRTARDFLLTKDMQKMLADNLDADFNVYLVVCKAFFAQLKTLDYPNNSDRFHIAVELFDDIILYSRLIESEVVQKNLLDAIGRFVLTRAAYFGLRQGSDIGFVEYLVKTGSDHYSYIAKVLFEKPHLAQSHGSALLVAAIPHHGTYTRMRNEDVKEIKLILDSGASPNEDYGESTIWGSFLEIPFSTDETKGESLRLVIEALLSHGANPKQYLKRLGKPADEILLEHFGEIRAQEMLSKARSPA
ncbi:MAG: hypothetical protein Q9214_003176, partial [Letrouitia sp. 1 TL-2023]